MPRPTIELSMIVRDGGASLARCLGGVRRFVDRIVVGDTGSADDSRSIAESFGAEVVPIPWQNDFAAARNQVLATAQCDWILVLDADEMLDPVEAAFKLPGLVLDENVHAYTLSRRDYVDRPHFERLAFGIQPNPGNLPETLPYPGYVCSFHTRLFRRNPQVCFHDCVHEQITESIDRLGLYRTSASLSIHHFGPVETPAEVLHDKIRFYHQLGLKKIAKQPDNFDAHLQLGIAELFQMNRPEEALPLLCSASELRSRDGRAPLYAGISLLRLGRFAEALQSLLRAFHLGEDSAALHDAMGDALLCSGELRPAFVAYQRAYICSDRSPLAEAKVGLAEVRLGEVNRGLNRIRKALHRDPRSMAIRQLLEVSEQTLAEVERAIA
jgi:tetratricopeptide (TPR) repeat protein